jgi:hypothetical protein
VNEREIKYRIALLGDDLVSDEEKLEAIEILTGAGKDAIAPLIERLSDKKDALCMQEMLVHAGPLQSAGDQKLQVTVRYVVETILYRIIAPQRRAPEVKTRLDALKPKVQVPDMRAPIPWIADWNAFWRTHKGHSLADIKAWSAEEVDRRWEAVDKGTAKLITPLSLVPGEPLPSRRSGDDVDKERALYAKARATFREARRDPSKVSDAKRMLLTLGAANARVKVHTDFMSAVLK